MVHTHNIFMCVVCLVEGVRARAESQTPFRLEIDA